jgi:lysophospholipase L1-like esterase
VLGALAVLGAQMRWMSDTSAVTFRGGILLASLATVVLVAALLESRSPWRTVMDLAPLRWVGERSYGIYLWHWPVLIISGALFPYAVGTTRGWVVLGSALALTLVLAELSLRLLERPVRRRGLRRSVRDLGAWLLTPWQDRRLPRIVAGVVVLLLVLSGVALLTAPEKSSTQVQIEDAQARLDGTGENAGSAPTLAADGGTGPAASAMLGLVGGEDEPVAPEEKAEAPAAKASPDEDAADEAKAEKTEKAEKGEVNGTPFAPDADGLLVPAGEQLTAVGDSLVVTSADGLTYRFPGINYVAKSNRQWGDAAPIVAAAITDGSVRDNVVLHLGTNAGVDEDALRATLDALGPERNVVVMNLYVRASFTESSNSTIEEVVADYPNAVVGDWNGTISTQPEVLQSDGVHPDIDGMHVYAEVVARAFDSLAEQG